MLTNNITNNHSHNYSTSIESEISKFIDSNNIKEIINFITTKSIEELMKMRMGENAMTLFHKITFNMNLPLLHEVIKCLDAKGAKKEVKTILNIGDVDGNTPLHYSAYNGSIDIIKTLLGNGADYNMKTNKGLTVMHMAAQGNQPTVLIFFKEQLGMCLFDTDDNGSTPLHWACYSSAEVTVNFLLALEANINSKDYTGQTALHIAIFTENINIIRSLLLKKPDLTIRNNDGRTVNDLIPKAINSFGIQKVFKSTNHIRNFCYNDSTNTSCYNSPIAFFSITIGFIAILYFFLLSYLPMIYTKILLGFFMMIMISFGYVSNADPGFSQTRYTMSWLKIINENPHVETLCPYCKVQGNKLTRHCFQCNHCVKERFHHCNWIANCIGDGNYKHFIVFLLILLGTFAYVYYIGIQVYLLPDATPMNHMTLLFSIPHIPILRRTVSMICLVLSLSLFLLLAFVLCKQIRKQLIYTRIKAI